MRGNGEGARNGSPPSIRGHMRKEISQTGCQAKSGSPFDLGIDAETASPNLRTESAPSFHSAAIDSELEGTRSSRGACASSFPDWTRSKPWTFWGSPTGFITFLIGIYRLCISPLFPPCCRFTPSCSAYAMDALQQHSLFRALWLILTRLLRCNPFCRGGHDPVPPSASHP